VREIGGKWKAPHRQRESMASNRDAQVRKIAEVNHAVAAGDWQEDPSTPRRDLETQEHIKHMVVSCAR